MKPLQFHRGLLALAARSAALVLVLASANIASAQLNNTTNGPNAVTTNGTGAGASMTTGDNNTAYGFSALQLTNTGIQNTAIGSQALKSNVLGDDNTAIGYATLFFNTASGNTALGSHALQKNTGGVQNTASGNLALYNNTTGSLNTAAGRDALYFNLDGASNVAVGYRALYKNTSGDFNVALGDGALQNTTGTGNIGIGEDGGFDLTTGDNNISIGNKGLAGESGIIRIGTTKTSPTIGLHTDTFLAGIIHGNGSDLTNLPAANVTGTIATTQIANLAVTTNKIGSAQVTSPKLATNLSLTGTTTGTFSGNLTGNATTATSAISFTGPLAGDVTGTQSATAIGAGAVTNAKLANGAVTSAKLASALTFSGTTVFNNFVGIGTSSPSSSLEIVRPSSPLSSSNGVSHLSVGVSSGQHIAMDHNEIMSYNGKTPSTLYLGFFGGNVSLAGQSGNVGIGTASPSTKLDVNGTATATIFSGSGAGLTNVPATSVTGQISTTQIANAAVTTAKLANAAVTSPKLAANLTLGGTTTATFTASGDSDMQGNILKNPALGMLLYHPSFSKATQGGTLDIIIGDGVVTIGSSGSGQYSEIIGGMSMPLDKPGTFISARAGWPNTAITAHVFYIVAGDGGGFNPPYNGFGFKAVGTALKGVTINNNLGGETEVDLATALTGLVNLLAVRRATSIEFYVNGVLKGSSSTNLPTVGGGYVMYAKNNGTVSDFAYLSVGFLTIGIPMF